MPVERDATAGKYRRSKYLCLVKLLTQAVSSGRVVSYACTKSYHSWLVPVLEVRIPTPGEIADTGGEF